MMWEIQRRIKECTELPENWDSHGAKPLDPRHGKQLTRLLSIAKGEPGISPTVDGGITCEWRLGHLTLMVEFGPDGMSAYYCDEAAHEEYELTAVAS